ncbi:MAG: head-tail adaptor protein [Neomegalonema sp.]|nr:head-tail adaptor protein [Neomegalonema sp.]
MAGFEAHSFDRRVTFRHQPVRQNDSGGMEADGDPVALERWARMPHQAPKATAEAISAGGVRVLSEALLVIRDGPKARQITESWHVEIDGVRWNIREIRIERDTRQIALAITKGSGV